MRRFSRRCCAGRSVECLYIVCPPLLVCLPMLVYLSAGIQGSLNGRRRHGGPLPLTVTRGEKSVSLSASLLLPLPGMRVYSPAYPKMNGCLRCGRGRGEKENASAGEAPAGGAARGEGRAERIPARRPQVVRLASEHRALTSTRSSDSAHSSSTRLRASPACAPRIRTRLSHVLLACCAGPIPPSLAHEQL